LRLHGFIENQNLEVLPGGFGFRNEELAELAAALVKAAPDAIVAGPELPLRALRAATRTVPIIGISEDLVAEGQADSLAHPGGNITGISLLSPELDGKRQEILIEAVPAARQIAAMFDAEVTQPYHLQMLQHAARSRGVKLSILGVNGPEEIAAAIDGAKALGVEALNFLATPLFSVPGSRNNQIVLERLATVRLPAIFQWPETAEAAPSWHTARALLTSIVSAGGLWRRYFAVPNLPKFRWSNLPGSNWYLILRPRKLLTIKFRLDSWRAPIRWSNKRSECR
jgi:putative ABC transport system substrate-binding protein